MKQIVPGIWTWSVHDDERNLDFNGWYVRTRAGALVIDPPEPGGSTLREIDKLGRPSVVLLTNKHHARGCETVREFFDCPIAIHELDNELLQISANQTFVDGDTLACGLLAVTVQSGKTPGETAFLVPTEVRALIVGDAVIGKPPGALSMLPDQKFSDPAAAKAGLGVLLDHEFEALLLGDGQSILEGGRQALVEFLAG